MSTNPALSNEEDPFLWLENIDSEESLAWVRAENLKTDERFSSLPLFSEIEQDSRAILDSEERIVYPTIRGAFVYNFWQDASHERGILRRSLLSAFLEKNPNWETVLDIDALSELEGVKWVYKGSLWYDPNFSRCLIRLSPGGGDAVAIREFDTGSLSFVENGFKLPAAKSYVTWIDPDTLCVGTDFGPGWNTESGYPRVLKIWKRGHPLDKAIPFFEADASDLSASSSLVESLGREPWLIVTRNKTFYTRTFFIQRNGNLQELELPEDCELKGRFEDSLIVELKSDLAQGSQTFSQGSILSISLDSLLAGEGIFQTVVPYRKGISIDQVLIAQDALYVNLLENISSAVYRFTISDGIWNSERIDTPTLGTISLMNVRHDGNDFFLNYESFLAPDTLYYAQAKTKREIELKKQDSLTAFFDASNLEVQQLHATSEDGTLIPYFIVHRKDLILNEMNPTLLYGYGGFEISLKPHYSAIVGTAWLARGGVYVVGNIRGGGEFGPSWHQAALKENRQRAYDDFKAIAQDLIDRKIASPKTLGIYGGSNGGLLVGVACTQHPELYNAVVCAVPLLDMKRYNKLLAGASWMGEYGDPDIPEQWAYISQYSPYQNLDPNRSYPEVLFTTSTRDDRVHPGHARKMMARMNSMQKPALYYENIEGGHGGSSTNAQRAYQLALTYSYLWDKLAPSVE